MVGRDLRHHSISSGTRRPGCLASATLEHTRQPSSVVMRPSPTVIHWKEKLTMSMSFDPFSQLD
ncbi:MAG: hypothetical protein ACTHON_03775, partial [Humibacter sp.]